MEFIGVINAVSFWTILHAPKIVDRCTKLRKKIGQKCPKATKNCWQALAEVDATPLASPAFKTGAEKLNRLHYALSKVAVLEYNMRSVKGLSIILLILVAVSMALGVVLEKTPLFADDLSKVDSRMLDWVFYYIPIALFFWQLVLVWKIHKADDFIKSIRDDEIPDLLDWDKE